MRINQLCRIAIFVALGALPQRSVATVVRGQEEKMHLSATKGDDTRLRGLKKRGGGSGSVANDGLIEAHSCVAWEKIPESQRTSPNGDSECSTNSCSNGCCRAYHWLLCDSTNSFPTLPCVCNDLTQNPENFVPYSFPPISVPAAVAAPGSAPGSSPARRPGNKKKRDKHGMMMK